MREPVRTGDGAVVAIRPDDLVATLEDDGALPATLSASEFRGQEFVGFARTADGVDLSFRSPMRLQPGGTVHLHADPDRVLVFSGGEA